MQETVTPEVDTECARANSGPTWATGIDSDHGYVLWSHQSMQRGRDLDGNVHRPVLYRGTRPDGKISSSDAIYPFASDAAFSVSEARRLAEAILELCDAADSAR